MKDTLAGAARMIKSAAAYSIFKNEIVDASLMPAPEAAQKLYTAAIAFCIALGIKIPKGISFSELEELVGVIDDQDNQCSASHQEHTFRFHIAGWYRHGEVNAGGWIRDVSPHTRVTLERESDNPKDTHAIAIYSTAFYKKLLGYVPADRAVKISHWMDARGISTMTNVPVIKIRDSGQPHTRAMIEVMLKA